MAIELTTASAATLSGIQVFTSNVGMFNMYPNALFAISMGYISPPDASLIGDTVDFSHPNFRKMSVVVATGLYGGSYSSLTKIIGGENLISVRDMGTTQAIVLSQAGFSAATLNAFFTALPATVRTATINVAGTTGAATCTTSIATAKGYTVVTS